MVEIAFGHEAQNLDDFEGSGSLGGHPFQGDVGTVGCPLRAGWETGTL
jgi:hypothetical protein